MAAQPPLHEASNTSSWVDEIYARRLARLDLSYVGRTAAEETPLFRLASLRKSRIYLREEIVRGVGVKKSIRAYFLDLSPSGDKRELSILHCDYDPRNGRVRPGTSATPVHVAISQHALERLHERLKTNALGDVIRLALLPLSRISAPLPVHYERDDLVVRLDGLGVCPVRVIGAFSPSGRAVPCWGVASYISRPPRPDEIVVNAVAVDRQ